MSPAGSTDQKPWIAIFDEEDDDPGEGTCQHDLRIIIVKDYILSDEDGSTAMKTAHRIQEYYDPNFRFADPINRHRFHGHPDMEAFVGEVYEIIYRLARVIPYNDPTQEKLLLLVSALRELPPTTYKIWNKECLVWTREPVSKCYMDDHWNGNHLSEVHLEWEIKARKIKDIPRYYQKACDEFLNFSCFLARYLEAGLMDESPDRCKYSGIDVREALDHDLPQGPLRDCQLMVAAQHILLAGRVLAEECFNQSFKGFGPDKWRRWAAKLEEISRREREKNESLASAAKDAHEYMLSLPYEPPTST